MYSSGHVLDLMYFDGVNLFLLFFKVQILLFKVTVKLRPKQFLVDPGAILASPPRQEQVSLFSVLDLVVPFDCP